MNVVCFVLGLLWLSPIYLTRAETGNNTDLTEYSGIEDSQSCEQYYSSCVEINPSVSGIYKIKVGIDVFDVYCDSIIAGMGWTVIQRRVSDEVNFYRKFSSYEQGFGDLNGSFWLGLDKIYKITSSQSHELYVHLQDFSGESRFARYSLFRLGDAYSQYTLKSLGTYKGSAGNSLAYHLNQRFSTFDRDYNGCAKSRLGAWWYKNCQYSNLNGLYLGGDFHKDLNHCGVSWNHWKGDKYSLKTVYMMVRPLYI